MSQRIIVFGSSTAYSSVPPEMSYVDLLIKNNPDVTSRCMNGHTIWHANYMLPRMMDRRGHKNQVVILHVGASEAITMNSHNFLELSSYWLNFGEIDHYFMTFIAPKIYQAASGLGVEAKTYFSLLTEDEFEILYDKMLKHLGMFHVLAMGMSDPKVDSDIIKERAFSFDSIIKNCCAKNPGAHHIDVWNLCAGEVVDSNHLTAKGHETLYEEIMRKING